MPLQLPIHPHLIALRSAATVVLSLLVGQAGWAAAFLGRSDRYFGFHVLFAFVTLAACVASMIVYLVLRRTAGRLLLIMMASVLALVITQVILGELKVASVHIFVGILTCMAGTALTSWTYRHPPPTAAA